ncbi:MAG TPA: hypothetical protein PLP01_06790 [Phycisphaerae bacterium]|nr:hypothetical protein [Phycisphaerae bacterium]HOI54939.1 hypothetical protein [Phycisphaerae bacterium]
MEFIKRQMWLVVTLGVIVVLSVPSLVLWFSNRSKSDARIKVYKTSRDKVSKIDQVVNRESVEYVKEAAAYRQQEREEILKSQRKPLSWPLLVPGVLPNYPGDTRVYEFKNKYNLQMKEFARVLGAVSDRELPTVGMSGPMLYKEEAFFKAQWIREPTINQNQQTVIEQLRESQDDIYIQEDIVQAIKRTNDLYFQAQGISPEMRTIAKAVVKELHQIGIGRAYDRLPEINSPRADAPVYQGGRRDRVLADRPGAFTGFGGSGTEQVTETEKRAETLTGHATNNNGEKYKVMPFRLVVIADAGNYHELLRQLSGTRSFFVVESVRVDLIPETDSAYKNYGLTISDSVPSRLMTYGPRPLAQVTVVGESLIFYGTGRPTLPAEQSAGSTGSGA